MAYARILPSILRRKACEGKQSYTTRTKAKDAIKQLVRKHHSTTVEAYRCPHCQSFHLGTPPKTLSTGQRPHEIAC